MAVGFCETQSPAGEASIQRLERPAGRPLPPGVPDFANFRKPVDLSQA